MFDFSGYTLVGTSITLNKVNNTVMEGCARGEVSVYPRVTDLFVMRRVVKQEVHEFIIPRGMKNRVLLGESHQEFFEKKYAEDLNSTFQCCEGCPKGGYYVFEEWGGLAVRV